jgi:hypothetical protein
MCDSPHPHQTTVLVTATWLYTNWQSLGLRRKLLVLKHLLLLLQRHPCQSAVLALEGGRSNTVHGKLPAWCNCCIL